MIYVEVKKCRNDKMNFRLSYQSLILKISEILQYDNYFLDTSINLEYG
jgi:hypothetical protein